MKTFKYSFRHQNMFGLFLLYGSMENKPTSFIAGAQKR